MSQQAEDVRFRFDELELDGRSLELRRAGSPVPLQPQPARALALLLRRAGETVTREELREHLWGTEHHLDYEQGINFTIRKIRAALGDDPQNPRFLETVPRRGYRFVAPVEVVPIEPLSEGRAASPRRAWSRGKTGAVTAVALGALTALAGALYRPAPETVAADARLAVLPFTRDSIAPLDAAVPNVVTEELVTHLAGRYGRRLGIVTMSSAQVFGDNSDDDEIGERLDADFLLRGNVSRSAGGVRITVRLWRVDDEVHLWARAFETDVAQLPEWYERVAARVADALGMAGSIPPAKAPPPVPRGPYETYLRGRYLVGRGDEASILRGIEALRDAVAAAPDLARGHAALADAYLRLIYTHPAAEIADPAETAARKAVELEPDLAEGQLALANVLLYLRTDWRGAGQAFRRALDLEPGAARTLHGYGLYLASLGRHDEAIATIRRAVDLDPATVYISSDLAQVYFWARRYDDAAAQARENLAAEPGHLPSRACLIDALARQGDLDEALHQQNVLFEQLDRPAAATWPDALEQALDLLVKVDEDGRHFDVTLAALLLAQGEADSAMARLAAACREHGDWTLPFIAVDPRLDELRTRPDYSTLAPCLAPLAG